MKLNWGFEQAEGESGYQKSQCPSLEIQRKFGNKSLNEKNEGNFGKLISERVSSESSISIETLNSSDVFSKFLVEFLKRKK
jgi:hypothetical protein